MENVLYIIAPFIVSTWLFIRDCQLDRKRRLENERKGNLNVLTQSLKFFKERNIVPEHDFEKEIKILEDQNFEVSIWDYLPFRRISN